MREGFGHLAVGQAGRFDDPDKPGKAHQFAEPAYLARCIELLLPTALDHELVADLPRRLEESAKILDSDFRIEEARRAVRELSEGFENYLQLIALLKYSRRSDVLFGDDIHRGLMYTSLGGLLYGRPEPNIRGGTGQAPIFQARLVTYEGAGGGLRDRVYREAKRIRNEVHLARPVQPVELLRDAKVVFAAYLFATEENAKLIAHSLYEHRSYLKDLLARLRTRLPFVVDPELDSQAPDHGDQELGPLPTSSEDRSNLADFQGAATTNCPGLRFAVYGDPGAGKTTFVRELTRRLAAAKRQAPLGDIPLPVLIEANRYTGEASFGRLVARELNIGDRELSNYSRDNPLLVLIDGLNEIPAQASRLAISELQNLSAELKDVGFVITSRFPRVFHLLGFRSFKIAPFDDDRVRKFVAESLSEDSAEEFSRQLYGLPRLLELCRNPLLLHMLVDISSEQLAIPKNRGRLLHEFMTRFLVREEPQISPVSPATMRLLLSRLAFDMRLKKVVSLSTLEVEQFFQAGVGDLQAGVGAVDVHSAILGANLLHDVGDGRLVFFHELVQEYFAALELLRRFRSGETNLESLTSDDWWREVVVLAYGLAEGDMELFGTLADSDLSLVARAVMDAPDPDIDRQADVVERAVDVIEHEAPGQGSAFEALAVVWSDEALGRVASALGSRSQVTDFVQRFTRDPYRAAADLLEARPTTAIVAGVGQALRRTPRTGSREQRCRLLARAIGLIKRKADGGATELSYEGLAEIALLGMAVGQESVLYDGISTLLDVSQVEYADRLSAQFAPNGRLDRGLSGRLSSELLLCGLPYARCQSIDCLDLSEEEWGNLIQTALAMAAYDWTIGLAKRLQGSNVQVLPLRPFAVRLIRTGNGARAGKVLRAIGGRGAATDLLRSMVVNLEIPPDKVGDVTAWLDDPVPLRSRMTDYLRLALRRRCDPTCYAGIAVWAEAGDASADLGRQLSESLVEEQKWEAALLVLYAADLRGEYSQLVSDAEKALDPRTKARDSPCWNDLVYNKYWTDWSPEFQARLLAHAECHATSVAGHAWSQGALDALRTRLRSGIQILERVIKKGGCELVGIEAEAAEAVRDGIVGVINKADPILAFGLASEWGFNASDLTLDDKSHAVMCQTAEAAARNLAEAGEIQQAFSICEAWLVDARRALPNMLDASTGLAPPEWVVAGFDGGVFTLSEVEAWFLTRLRRGEIGKALSLRQSASLRRELYGTSILAVLELFDDSRFREAGQVMAAFKLQDDFRAELQEIVPHLVVEGKSGVAFQLVQALGPTYSAAFGDVILRTARERLAQGDITNLVGLIDSAEMNFVRDEFSRLLARHLADAIEQGRRDDVQRVLETPSLASMLTSPQLVLRAIYNSDARMPATVTNVEENRRFAFAALCMASIPVFVHSSVLEDRMDLLEKGSQLMVTVQKHPKGLRATWATIASKEMRVGPVRKTSAHDDEGRSMRKLRDAWGARLRDAR